MKNLVKLGIILEGPKVGRSKTYRLNPAIGWKGSARGHVTALDAERRRRVERMKEARISGVIEGGDPQRDDRTGDLFPELNP